LADRARLAVDQFESIVLQHSSRLRHPR
jgi:hypothetical protein